jgi:Flp pilus assembly pilin Flp
MNLLSKNKNAGGQALVEYAIILVLVVVVVVVVVSLLGPTIGNVLSTVVDELNSSGSGGGSDPPPPPPPPSCYGSGLLPSLIVLMCVILGLSSLQTSMQTLEPIEVEC